MKKRIWISVGLCTAALLIGILIGVLRKPDNQQAQTKTIENPVQITYFSDMEKTEKFTVNIPEEYNKKIFISLNGDTKGIQKYTFKHAETGAFLFTIFVCEKGKEEKITETHSVIKTTENYTYCWCQYDFNHETITEEQTVEELTDIMAYYEAIKSSIVIE